MYSTNIKIDFLKFGVYIFLALPEYHHVTIYEQQGIRIPFTL